MKRKKRKNVDFSVETCLVIMLYWVSHCLHQKISIQNKGGEIMCCHEIDKRDLKGC